MDYKLYPIPLSDINRPIYYMVKSFMSYKIGEMPKDELDEEWQRLRVKVVSNDYKLSFPSYDLSEPYDTEGLQQEVIILKDDTLPPPTTNWPDDNDDDEFYSGNSYEPVERQHLHYYIDIAPETNQYRLNRRRFYCGTAQIPKPIYFNNTPQFRQALSNMMEILWKAGIRATDWLERIKTAHQMLEEHVNELHILHNAGLYDFHVLKRILASSFLEEKTWKSQYNIYVGSLKIFAMHAANNLSWNNYSCEHGAVYRLLPLYQKEAIDEERLRRKKMKAEQAAKKEEEASRKEEEVARKAEQPRQSESQDWKQLAHQQRIQAREQQREQSRKQPRTEYQQKENREIRKNILIFVAALLFLFAMIWLFQYSYIGSITGICGAVLGTIIIRVRYLARNYHFTYPLWFRETLIYTAIFVAFGGILACRELSRYICESSNGLIGPGLSFAGIAALMVAVFVWSYRKSKCLEEKSRRIYTLLMVISTCLIFAQCIGSISYSSDRQQEQWEKQLSDTSVVE